MRSHFRLRRRDTRWLMFPVLVVLCGLLTIGIVVFTPGSETAVAEPVLAMKTDLQPVPQLSDPAGQPDR